jgi:hypothetical protein
MIEEPDISDFYLDTLPPRQPATTGHRADRKGGERGQCPTSALSGV